MGNSAGGYAAILFGSLLGVTSVLAFIPLTVRRKEKVDEKYRDISGYIHGTTQYYLYGDTAVTDPFDCHHIQHCERIAHHPNVYLTRMKNIQLREMRNTGELFKIIHNILH